MANAAKAQTTKLLRSYGLTAEQAEQAALLNLNWQALIQKILQALIQGILGSLGGGGVTPPSVPAPARSVRSARKKKAR